MIFLPDEFYILHVEDNKIYANQDDVSHLYESTIKAPVEKVLAEHRIKPADIVWVLARDMASARRELQDADRDNPLRGFDAVFCDLKIPPDPQHEEEPHQRYGLEVARTATEYGWPGPVIGLSQYARSDDVLESLQGLDIMAGDRPVFDDLLLKSLQENESLFLSKLRRCLVPTARYTNRASKWSQPCFFLSKEMWGLMRDLVLISRRPAKRWPLSMILLLGDPGSGKGMLARTFDQLLREYDEAQLYHDGGDPEPAHVKRVRANRTAMQVVNCASLVSEAHGGAIRLFGCRNFQGVADKPGVFEAATKYGNQHEVVFDEAGVVFLDEFAELAPRLQAAVLNALQEGEIYREGADGTPVKIGCHVVFATNARIGQPSGVEDGPSVGDDREKLREDLLDRIPYVLSVPSLRERYGEVMELIRNFAASRLEELREPDVPVVTVKQIHIEKSTVHVINRALSLDLIHSVRQLKLIADVMPGETQITDANVSWLLRRARELPVPPPPAAMAVGPTAVSTEEMARWLELPQEFQEEDLPEDTIAAIDALYARQDPDEAAREPRRIFHGQKNSTERLSRFYMLLKLLQYSNERRFLRVWGQSVPAFNQALQRSCVGRIDRTRNQADNRQKYIEYLFTNIEDLEEEV